MAALLRLFVLIMVVAALIILFAYAFVAALIITPILFLLIYVSGRKPTVEWWVVRSGADAGARPGQVIEHDPNDLPLEHRAEKWEPVLGKNDTTPKS